MACIIILNMYSPSVLQHSNIAVVKGMWKIFINLHTSIIAIYAPMIYTAPCVMFLMRTDKLRGQVVEGWALDIETFLGPVKS